MYLMPRPHDSIYPTSIEKLLAHKDKSWEHNIKPGNVSTVNRLISAFQNVFKNFKAKN